MVEPAARVVLGHPIGPPGKPRPKDEAALEALACPTLVVQGDRDELGPLPLLEKITGQNPRVELSVLAGAGHDFGRVEARLNALPQFVTEIDDIDVHFIHVRSSNEDALPLIMTHGWPGSVIEQIDTVGPLTDPTAHGGSADDAFYAQWGVDRAHLPYNPTADARRDIADAKTRAAANGKMVMVTFGANWWMPSRSRWSPIYMGGVGRRSPEPPV